MHDWSLGAGDPLYLMLAADARLCKPDYLNDHIWEIELGGEPPALGLRTTYGMRARSMRIFPRFTEGQHSLTDPAGFVSAPRLRRFYPNSLTFDFVPFEGVAVAAEYWIPDSHTVAARFTLTNQGSEKRQVQLEVCGMLAPLDGQGLASTQQQMVHILASQTGGLVPVIFITGGPKHGQGPFSSLLLDVELGPGATRQFTMAQAAMDTLAGSFELARRTAARPWDAERARIEIVNAADTLEIETGEPSWDAALAFSQTAALGMAMAGTGLAPQAGFVSARHPDHGFSRKGDASDCAPAWSGITPLEAEYLGAALPGSPQTMRLALESFLSTQTASGEIDHKPGPAGQRSKLQAAPMLADLAWRYFRVTEDRPFLEDAYPKLTKFFRAWLAASHDRDQDGTPEWDHILQTGFDDSPLFDVWNPWSQGLNISFVHSPSLLAMLYSEAQALIKMAKRLARPEEETALLNASAGILKQALQAAWSPRLGLYLYRDRETGASQPGKLVAKRRGAGNLSPHTAFEQPTRLMIEVQTKNPAAKRPAVEILEDVKTGEVEKLDGHEFQWRTGGLVATTRKVYSRLDLITVEGLDAQDRIIVKSVDTTMQDLTLALPLWAGVPAKAQAQALVSGALMNTARFERACGLSMLPVQAEGLLVDRDETDPGEPQLATVLLKSFSKTPLRLGRRKEPVQTDEAEAVSTSVELPWNTLIGEGLLHYGFRAEAVRLVTRLMRAVIMNLVQHHTFHARYHAERGAGIGERSSLRGLAPVGLFLEALGVRILSPGRVRLEQVNLFPWPVTIRYRGLTIVRDLHHTDVTFPNGQSITVRDRAACIVSM